jgi:acetolactate decarboxylase
MVASIPNDVFQFSTWSAVQSGFNEGQPRTTDLSSHGNHGIGMFEDGRLMLLLEGKAWAIDKDLRAEAAPMDAKLPFAMVTFFETDQSNEIEISGSEGLRDQLLPWLDPYSDSPPLNSIVCFGVYGTFSHVELEASHGRKQTSSFSGLKGTIFGYSIPTWMEGISGPPLHCHFLSERAPINMDAKVGGRVVNFATDEDCEIEVGKCGRFHLGFPRGLKWEALDLTGKPA